MSNFLFDVKLWASVRIDAPSEAEARAVLDRMTECGSVTFHDEKTATTYEAEASSEGEKDLVEVDGEMPE